jgi:hypothetical protein
MIINKKQIIQIMSLVSEYSNKLRTLGFESTNKYADDIDILLSLINSQQEIELKNIE